MSLHMLVVQLADEVDREGGGRTEGIMIKCSSFVRNRWVKVVSGQT